MLLRARFHKSSSSMHRDRALVHSIKLLADTSLHVSLTLTAENTVIEQMKGWRTKIFVSNDRTDGGALMYHPYYMGCRFGLEKPYPISNV